MFDFLIIFVSFTSIFFLLQKLQSKNNFWKKSKVPFIESQLIFLGNMGAAFFGFEHISEALDELYHHPKAQNQEFVGFNLLWKPAILIRDPHLVKKFLLSKKISNKEVDPQKYFKIVDRMGKNLASNIVAGEETNASDLILKYMLDTISLVSLGIELNSLNCNEKPQKRINFKKSLMQSLKERLIYFLPELSQILRVKNSKSALADFFDQIFNDQKIYGNDVLDKLLQEKEDSNVKDLLFEGFESTNHSIITTLYFISLNVSFSIYIFDLILSVLHFKEF